MESSDQSSCLVPITLDIKGPGQNESLKTQWINAHSQILRRLGYKTLEQEV